MDHFKDFSTAVNWIEGIVPFGIKPGLKRMDMLLDKLGHPERGLSFVHVAGTNGKGSTCAFLTEMLLRSGYSVGTFTSPCIERFTNRIKCSRVDIPEHEVLAITNRLKPLVDEVAQSDLGHPTMFEVTTCMAFVYFSQVRPDFVVLEVGQGGRLDSTNVITPLVSVITNIGHDHMAVLGDSLEKIAYEKAGIIKRGIPVVSSVEQEEVIGVIRQRSEAQGSPLYLLKRDFDFEEVSSKLNEQVFNFRSAFGRRERLQIWLNGRHQFKNASVALMALEVLRAGHGISLYGLEEGLARTEWAGRLEMVSSEPRIVLDGAHNPEGAQTLADALRTIYSYNRLNLMMGMLNTKEHTEYLKHMLPLVDTLIVTEPAFRNQMPANDLLQLARRIADEHHLQIRMYVEPEWKNALKLLYDVTKKDDLAVVSGTLYLISDVRSWILYKVESYKGF
ncbi:bifunctional folylpolyglutamate synthase/dihydrofolate synthase [Paenibacillus allorhizosphaerae]|uniref:tetrahydrofolate synthase n=1 Tax=Paenibacillus allorhizosphaerae TaxID=2849866 RepID=A0ABM8VG77_9BACL|nr:folylpolyglutamate synthase/dihydrofolate synthase family protein [Paenibacillus allorhizosphaerae]CAG7637290.1 Folylpolyglutamate synthase [Paenibacillus allorhizosphaerae]